MDKDNAKQRVLLVMSDFRGYYKEIADSLSKSGYDVDYITMSDHDIVSRIIVRTRHLGYWLRGLHFRLKYLNKRKEYDLIIAIACYSLPEDVFNLLRRSNPKARLILYLWDSISRYPIIKKAFKYFDDIKTFDNEDSKKYGFGFLPLFYINQYVIEAEPKKKCDYIFCFIGEANPRRYKLLRLLNEQIKLKGYRAYIHFAINKLSKFRRRIQHLPSEPEYFKLSSLSHPEVVEVYKKSKCVLDIEAEDQIGLSIRVFEALASGTKVVTTNKYIKELPFYNENNIYLLDVDKPYLDDSFLNSDFTIISGMVDYRIDRWLNRLLNN